MRTLLLLAVLLLVFFGLPILNGLELPASFAPQELGLFLKKAYLYWRELVLTAVR